ncbi:MAG TPA: ribbon-helix-helix protein, CopG family [Tepidisphaeraceae bacterium]|jgi:hypothetical protein|nr:ribbon-helix-helix protein, CopG family [Tepidisphaeraceae bacterium]
MDKRKRKREFKELTGGEFDALSNEEKERIYRQIDNAAPGKLWKDSQAMTAADRKRFAPIRKKMKMGRGKAGARVVSISVEGELLKRIDAFAKREGVNRTELFVEAVKLRIGA